MVNQPMAIAAKCMGDGFSRKCHPFERSARKDSADAVCSVNVALFLYTRRLRNFRTPARSAGAGRGRLIWPQCGRADST
jgi:hypothetical protein